MPRPPSRSMSRPAFPPDSSVVAEVVPSPNHGERNEGRRPGIVGVEYTGMPDAQSALELLRARGSNVSAHYFVFEDGRIVQMVPESRRAWHAGKSEWAGETDINSCSIGIEIANPGHDHGYPKFPLRQIAAVTALCRGIFTRHRIPADRVLAHSDIAPSRKRDPGEKFPWRILHGSRIGIWVPPAPIEHGPIYVLGDRNPAIEELQGLLAKFGYAVPVSGNLDGATRDAIAAFQRHFRQARADGVFDVSTLATLRA